MAVAVAEERRTNSSDRPTELVVEARGLEMRYGKLEALKGVDLEVARGEIFAVLGPNGAGKTTLLEILEGYRQRTGGTARVLGTDPEHAGRDWRARVGVVLQESEPEMDLNARECLALYAGYYPHALDVDQVLELVGLSDKANARATRLSGGQKRRIDVALALIGDPEVIFLDEPTTGFDPSARRAAWKMIAGLRRLGKTIILTTHYMEEAEVLSDRIAVIAEGRIRAVGTAGDLDSTGGGRTKISFELPPLLTVDDLPDQVLAAVGRADGARITLTTDSAMEVLHALSFWSLHGGHEVSDLTVGRPSLEDTYLKLTGESE